MRIRLTLPVAAVAAVAIALAAPAHADDNSNFLFDIKNAGINFDDASTTVTAGRTACRMLEAGSSDDEIVTNLEQQNPGFSHAKAQTFEQTAVTDLCPDDASGSDEQPAGADLGGGSASAPGSGSASGQAPQSGSQAGPPGSSTGTGPPNGTATH
ncbi:DUF732 domain-containing protein [Mycobacterium sp.]|uniref:DUF732 domain-containing protein n=1 Tax=Mycobacterium sp. TaxID=1785 RepID=UPI003CC51B58